MNRTVFAAAVALALGSAVYVAAQQPGPPPVAGAPCGRRGGGPPGGGPENGMNTRPPNAEGQKPAFAGQTRAPEQKLNVAFDVVTVSEDGDSVDAWTSSSFPDSGSTRPHGSG